MQPGLNQAFQLTSKAPAAIAVIEVQGPFARTWLAQHWTPNVDTGKPFSPAKNHIRYGTIHPIAGDREAGESVVLCLVSDPHQTDRFEIHCHGGAAAASAILHGLKTAGFLIQENPLSQFDAGSPIRSAATEDLVKSTSLRTAAILMDQTRGLLDQAFQSLRVDLVNKDQAKAIAAINQLLEYQRLGSHLTKPWKVVLAGPPNVGKSSLLNSLLGYQRAIVHPSAGTTRDRIVEMTSIGGWPVLLADVAGVRDADDSIEKIGVQRAMLTIEESDLVLLLIPADQEWSQLDEDIYQEICQAAKNAQILGVRTKMDLVGDRESEEFTVGIRIAETSIQDPATIERLLKEIEEILVPNPPTPGTPVPFRDPHWECLEMALTSVQNGDWNQAIEGLDRLLGNA